ncbi:MAG: InlB B-repeat-containing protein [Bacilli bacterium]|nr:InlB B-repeat-containing protein [Bacilli bacterium]
MRFKKIFFYVMLMLICAIGVNAPLKVNAATYEVNVQDKQGNNERQYEVSPIITIAELKGMIAEETNIPAARQKLVFSNTELEDSKTIAEYNIQSDATITLIPTWKLTFDSKVNNDATDITEVYVEDYDYYSPQTPVKNGYTFGGWFAENNNQTRFNFGITRINSDLNFHAYWAEEISEISVVLNAPHVGDSITLDGLGYPDSLPVVTTTDSRLQVYAYWIKGTCEKGLCEELFSGTFQKNQYYYAYIELEIIDANSYLFVPEVSNNISINGKAPEEVFDGSSIHTWFIAKVQAQSTTYKILSDKQTYILNSNNAISITADGNLNKLTGIMVDGILISSENYDLENGSTVLTLKSSYLDTLSVGNHTLEFVYSDGSVETLFAVSNAKDKVLASDQNTINPQTGDNVMCYISMLGLSVIVLAGIGFYVKKK